MAFLNILGDDGWYPLSYTHASHVFEKSKREFTFEIEWYRAKALLFWTIFCLNRSTFLVEEENNYEKEYY
ncbi:hypothetical protein LCR01_00730 [Companilactobacillus crustorum]|uniref:Uncharacterized protein n=2 Tax=Companilactobacillus TaxID=2767879 RepID=A0A2P4R4C1_9LACO|nr:hypothetical protein LCR01_00730 [Companilactobacillus crustorum]